MKPRSFYVIVVLAILFIETGIAVFVKDAFIRPFFGDFLATALVYFALRTFEISKQRAFLFALFLSFGIELLQLIHFLDWTGLGQFKVLRIVLGTSFSLADLAAYSLGGLLAYSMDVLSDKSADLKKETDVIRKVWSDPDAVLLIFAGASAEFALSKYVDWLFFTGKIPGQPIERMMSTLAYAKRLLFTESDQRQVALEELVKIHQRVGEKRGFEIPNEAFLDVLNMLIFYTSRAHELIFEPLSPQDKQFIINEFSMIGRGLQISNLPKNWEEFENQRNTAFEKRYTYSEQSKLLFESYRRNLGEYIWFSLDKVYDFILPKIWGRNPSRFWNSLIGFILFIGRVLLPHPWLFLLLPAPFKQKFSEPFSSTINKPNAGQRSHFPYLYGRIT